ncbi:hypothetical protein [Tenacibaculum maritimum]|uniref:hypothetical protein n=1 Tax=Tenacibaculum maritimum TaxID=107401 RepID=UPI001E63AA5B|nr:hypothetical protein [Tenacibaculum maritimum]MCD9611940.1 hypothetical protein [Tenacibaculum maritimum]
MADRYPTFSDLFNEHSFYLNFETLDFLFEYIGSSPTSYLDSAEGIDFLLDCRYFTRFFALVSSSSLSSDVLLKEKFDKLNFLIALSYGA